MHSNMTKDLEFNKGLQYFDIKRAKINELILAIMLEPKDKTQDDQHDNAVRNGGEEFQKAKSELRDWVLSLISDLAYVEFVVPIIFIIETKDKDLYESWNKVAGDQEWHSGDYGLIAARTKDAGNIFESIVKTFAVSRECQINPPTDKDIIGFIKDRANRIKRKDNIEEEIYKSLINLVENNIMEGKMGGKDYFSRWQISIEKMIENH